jgi:hypothetical protein
MNDKERYCLTSPSLILNPTVTLFSAIGFIPAGQTPVMIPVSSSMVKNAQNITLLTQCNGAQAKGECYI